MLNILGLLIGTKFLKETVLEFKAPDGSQSDLAIKTVDDYFGNVINTYTTVFVIVNTVDGSPVLTEKTEKFDEMLNVSVVGYVKDHGYECTTTIASYHALQNMSASLGGVDFSLIADAFLDNPQNPEAYFALISFQGNVSALQKSGGDFADWLDDEIVALKLKAGMGKDSPFEIRASGLIVFGRDVMAGTEHDLVLMDGISFPIALAILAYMVSSARLLIFPLLSIISTALVSFLIMYPVAMVVDVISFAPSVMMSLCVALSIDYSLFLLSRFRQEAEADPSRTLHSVQKMMQTAGHTVFVSGCTLSFCWFGLCMFPVLLLSTVGVAVGITTIVCLAVNLTLVPALLLTFPVFFSRFGCTCRRKEESLQVSLDAETGGAMHSVASAPTSPFEYASLRDEADASPDVDEGIKSSCWFRCGSTMINTKMRAAIISVIVIGVAIPLGYYGVNFSTPRAYHSFYLETKRVQGIHLSQHQIRSGPSLPYHLLVVGPDAEDEMCTSLSTSQTKDDLTLLPFPTPAFLPTSSFMGNLTSLVTDVLLPIRADDGTHYLTPKNVLSYAYLRGTPINLTKATACVTSYGKGHDCGSILLTFYQQTPTAASHSSSVQGSPRRCDV